MSHPIIQIREKLIEDLKDFNYKVEYYKFHLEEHKKLILQLEDTLLKVDEIINKMEIAKDA